MTPASPTRGDVEKFLAVDGWRQVPAGERGGRRQRHLFFEKLLPDGRLLQTHISHDRSKSIGASRFGAVLRDQLEVSRGEFWTAIDAGEPVDRPVALDEDEVVEHDAWVIRVLAGELHMSPDEIAALTEEEAKERVYAHWSED